MEKIFPRQITSICLFFKIEKSVIAARILANARNADSFFCAAVVAAGISVTDAIYGLLRSKDVRDP